jgi:succinyl-CoA synthetase beta subunit/citryl-CoA synthetase large subunit
VYLGITFDEAAKKAAVLASNLGGVDINEVSRKEPEKIVKVFVDPFIGFQQYQAKEVGYALGLPMDSSRTLQSIMIKLFEAFVTFDTTLTEVNPIGLTKDGELICCDAHIEIEDDALFRQRKRLGNYGIEEREDKSRPATEFEAKAAEIDRADYRGVAGRVTDFDGNLGLVIGAGGGSLTIFDALLHHGAKPANYCEVGGNAPVSKIYNLTKLILTKKGVKGLAVITNVLSNSRVDFLARGVVKAMIELDIDPHQYPALFRSAGAFEEDGYAILKKYGVRCYGRSTSLDQAAKLAEMMIGVH